MQGSQARTFVYLLSLLHRCPLLLPTVSIFQIRRVVTVTTCKSEVSRATIDYMQHACRVCRGVMPRPRPE
ncbi:hypothetical protein BGW36DRAFT_379033 [Talaromyces proteolyticus]|uniref:Secreted protein n=1 Tax=Talaromyces proteolyticus TaxID=1131652 RepID=A0AAD4PW96_9EURO|nr:uncharacterized protein BGW36DRAFT_379033 [Talaromyces proteolyticus]KAH8697605.1 hypothetical protein BGW36DRAFT_379033 [Talaromyces proteolyticus]